MNKKYTLFFSLIIIVGVVGIFVSSKKTYINMPGDNRTMISESAWEIVHYSTPTQSASIRGTDWFISFGTDNTGYLKLCETYPFTYTQETTTQLILSFQAQNQESTACQDTDGIQQFLLRVLEKPLVLEQKQSAADESPILIISDGQNKIALVSRIMDHTVSTAFSNTFLKKNQIVQVEPRLVCSGTGACSETLNTVFFPIVISGIDESGQNIADKKLMVQGNHTVETMLPVGTYTVTPGIPLEQPFHFEPVIFSITTIQEKAYTVPLVLMIGK